MKKSVFEMPMIPQTLNINNLRTTNANTKYVNLYAIRKLMKYSLKHFFAKAVFSLTVFEILLFVGRTVLSPAQWSVKSERVKNVRSPLPQSLLPTTD